MNPAHIHAQDAAWFFFFCLVVIGIAIWKGVKDENKDR
jgi:hypothetical protein